MKMTNFLIVAAIIAYMAIVVGVGFYFTSKNKSTDDFYLGGRQLGPFVTAMSAEASDMSSWLLMGLPGVALAGLVGMNGTFAEAVWTAIGLAVGTYVNWLIVAKRLRLYSEHINASTIPDYISNRFHDHGLLVGISAIIIIVFFVPYVASGFAGVGKLFNSLFGIDYHLVMVVGAVVIATYTLLGGFLAASTTDFIQSIIMTMALIVVTGYGIYTAGGLDQVMENAKDVPNYFSLTAPDGSYSALPIASTMAWGLGYFGMPHILLRFMAIEDHQKLKMARRIASVWVVIAMGVAIFIGVIGYSFSKAEGLVGTEGFDPERIIVYIASSLSKVNPLLAIVAGLIISGILASIMSTSDSQLLAASSSVSENIIHKFIVRDLSEVNQMILARVTVVIIAVLSCVFAWDPNSSVFRIVSFAWAGFGASFGPVVLFSLFWKKTNKWGALLGIISGGAMVFIWKFGISTLGGIFTIYELLPAFIVSAVVIFVVSILTGGADKDVEKEYDDVQQMIRENRSFN